MENKKNVCWNCGNYKAYYTKGFCHFDKKNYGYCSKQQKTVSCHEDCEHYRSNYQSRRFRKTVALRALNDILTHLSEIRQILSEDKQDDAISPFPTQRR